MVRLIVHTMMMMMMTVMIKRIEVRITMTIHQDQLSNSCMAGLENTFYGKRTHSMVRITMTIHRDQLFNSCMATFKSWFNVNVRSA